MKVDAKNWKWSDTGEPVSDYGYWSQGGRTASIILILIRPQFRVSRGDRSPTGLDEVIGKHIR